MVIGFNHSGVVVKDLVLMVDFYCNTLGLSVQREIDSVAPPEGDHTGIPGARRKLVFVGKPEGGHLLELVHFVEPASPDGHLGQHQLGASHVCFNVEGMQELYERLSSQGVEFVTPPKFKDTPDGGRRGICYARDPEGNWLEFIESVKG